MFLERILRKHAIPILLIALFLLLAGCTIGPKGAFLASQKTFNEMVSVYHAYYQNCTPEKQAKLREDVHPKVIEALSILEAMNEAFRLGLEPSQIDRNKFRELRYALYKRLPKIFHWED